MSRLLIVYGSTTGNTEMMAYVISDVLRESGHEVIVYNVVDVNAEGLCHGYDAVLFGCSTWGGEEIELQEHFACLYANFHRIGLMGAAVACFGCGDSGYRWFCGALDAIEGRAKELGARIISPSLKIDGNPAAQQEAILYWITLLRAALSSVSASYGSKALGRATG